MAAGLTVRPAQIPELRAFLTEKLAGETQAALAADALDIDALITPGAAGRAMLDDFSRLDPFGPGNPEPLFAASSVRVAEVSALRGGHVRCVLGDDGGGRLRAVAWRAGETDLGRRLLARDGLLHVAGKLKPDDWKGRNGVELEIEDVADPRMA
jgi:single-stranded-DNA-specific exonuclease